jgi:hypothetical protein
MTPLRHITDTRTGRLPQPASAVPFLRSGLAT